MYESLGRSLETYSAAVIVSQLRWFTLFDQPTDIMIETSTFTASRSGMQSTTAKQVRLIEICMLLRLVLSGTQT